MSEAPMIGKLCDEHSKRDAIHIAIAPVKAGGPLRPGERVGVTFDGYASPLVEPIGIVDPFLTENLHQGQRFFLFLFPNTITSLRHVWTHPAFAYKGPANG